MTQGALCPEWIAVDWGTTRLRVWAMRGAKPLSARQSDQGMGRLDPQGFEPALMALIADWLPDHGRMPIIACGMVGARAGWAEAAYRPTPCAAVAPGQTTRPPVQDPRLDVQILPGLSQADPPDVMRGEETQIAGFLAEHPDFSGALCLPGTHSKWVEIAAGRITRFRTFLTGEMFALLSTQSVLRLSLGAASPDPAACRQAAAQAIHDPHALQTQLFGLRAGALLDGLGAEQAAGRLSGLLIGAELGAARDFWQETAVAVIGAPDLAALYARMLLDQGANAWHKDGAALVLSGLAAARTPQEPS